MIRTVIAEDERPLLRGLASMIQRADPSFVPVCLAKNGKEALEYLSQHEADVLFTDINMPVVDGIRLMEQLRKMNPTMPIVVISGYNEFEYPRQALRFGAVNYLLKPIDRPELEELLAELKSIIEKNAHAQKREAFIRALFGGSESLLDSLEIKPLSLLYLCAGPYQHEAGGQDLPVPGGLSDQEMREILLRNRPGESLWLFFGNKPNEAVWIAEGKAEFDTETLAEAVRLRLGTSLPLTAVFREGLEAKELVSAVAESEQWLKIGVLPGRSRLIKAKPEPYELKIDFSSECLLKLAFQRGDYDDILSCLQDFWSELPEAKRTQAVLESFLTEVLLLAYDEAGETDESHRDAELQVWEFIEANDSAEGILEAAAECCCRILKDDEGDAVSNDRLMEELDLYIREHLTEPLTLKDLSRRFGLVAPYLSKLFKGYKGMSPTEYIRHLRMENAKTMLRDHPELLVKDIAAGVGYDNPLYFSRIFKKHVGVYPSEYRSGEGKS